MLDVRDRPPQQRGIWPQTSVALRLKSPVLDNGEMVEMGVSVFFFIIYHSLAGLESRNYFLTVLEARSLRTRYHQTWFLVRSLFLACRRLLSCGVLTQSLLCACTYAERAVSIILLLETHQSFQTDQATSYNLNYLRKALSPNTVTLRAGSSTYALVELRSQFNP